MIMLSFFYDAIAAYFLLKYKQLLQCNLEICREKKKTTHSSNTCVHQERFMQNYANQLCKPELLSMCCEVVKLLWYLCFYGFDPNADCAHAKLMLGASSFYKTAYVL